MRIRAGAIERATDADLASRAAGGDTRAFEELYRRHSASAWHVAYSVTGDREDAADAVSEAFTRVLQALPAGRLQSAELFRPYLLTATRNAALDGLRRRGRSRPAEYTGELDRVVATGPSDAVVAGVESSLVATAFRNLPERWRSVLWLTEVEGVPPREAAAMLGVSPNGVAQLAVRARAGLRERYLQAHIQGGDVQRDCRYTVQHLGAYVADRLPPRDLAKVDQHLAGCEACRARRDELEDLGSSLRRVIIPLPFAIGAAALGKWKLAAVGASASQAGRRAGSAAARLQRPMAAATAALFASGLIGVGVIDGPSGTDQRRRTGLAAGEVAPTPVVDIQTAAESSPVPFLEASPIYDTSTEPALVGPAPEASTEAAASTGTATPAPPPRPEPVAQIGVRAALGPVTAAIGIGQGPGSCTGAQVATFTAGCTPTPGNTATSGLGVSTGGSALPDQELLLP